MTSKITTLMALVLGVLFIGCTGPGVGLVADDDDDEPADDDATDDDSGDDDAGDDDGGDDVTIPPPEAVGDACNANEQCPEGGSGEPVCLTDGYPDGYCSVEGCGSHDHDCPDDNGLDTDGQGSKCVQAPSNLCLQLCDGDEDCREGYECVPKPDAAGHGDVDVCFPE